MSKLLSVEANCTSPTLACGASTPRKACPEARSAPLTQTSRVQTPSGLPAGFGEASRSETTANGPSVQLKVDESSSWKIPSRYQNSCTVAPFGTPCATYS